MSKESDDYERFVRKVMAALTGVAVHHRKTFVGRGSGRKIVVDLSFTVSLAGGAELLFVVECKCYGKSVPVDDVEEFHTKCDDIGVHKGIMVTTKGFQRGAKQVAMARGIALALLTKKKQPGELVYVVNAENDGKEPQPPDDFWQGNVLGLRGVTDGGLRFDSMASFRYFLIRDFIWDREEFAHKDVKWQMADDEAGS